MIRKTFILLFLLLITAYLIAAVTLFNTQPTGQSCKGMDLVINDSIDYGFITKQEVLKILVNKNLSPIGKNMNDVNTREMENTLTEHPLIENVECFRKAGNRIGIEVTQRLPIIRIMTDNGDNYYVDEKGKPMPLSNSSANVVVATGSIDHAFASKELYEFGKFLQNNPLWNAQIQQIHINPLKEIELVPRVGDHIIFLGKPGNYRQKFNRLEKFYRKALNKIGWNKYSRISLEFDNQIICTKKE